MTATICGSRARSSGTRIVPAMGPLSISICQSSVRLRTLTLLLPSSCPNAEKSATSSVAPANTSFIAIGRPEAARQREPFVERQRGQAPVYRNAARRAKLRQHAAEAQRRAPKRKAAIGLVARLELHREAPRRAEVAFRVETAVGGEHEIELQIRGLGRRFRKRLWQPQRDAREIRADRDPRGLGLIRAVRRDQQAALPARLSSQEVAQRQIERARHGVDRHFAFEIEARAIPLLLGRHHRGRNGAVEEDRLDSLARDGAVAQAQGAVDLRGVRRGILGTQARRR